MTELVEDHYNNTANIAALTRTSVFLLDKCKRMLKTWEDADSLRVDELQELNSLLPPERQRAIRKETFRLHPSALKLHLCPLADMAIPVETDEVRAAHSRLSRMFPKDFPDEDRYPVRYKKSRFEWRAEA